MKLTQKFNIGNYENITIESSEHNHGTDELNLIEANKEILFILEKKVKVIPELQSWINKYKQELIK